MAEKLIRTYTPSLIETLLDREKKKGAPLTEAEVLALRDSAPSENLTQEEAEKAEKERGYADVDAETCWQEWQHVRLQFFDSQ